MTITLTSLHKPWIAECDVCKQWYENHAGSTSCCGSLASVLTDEKGEIAHMTIEQYLAKQKGAGHE